MRYLYLEDPRNGANMVTIQGAHTIDLAIAVLGEFVDITALNTRQYPDIEVGDEHEPQTRTTFDHVLVQARLTNGAALNPTVCFARITGWMKNSTP